MAASPRVAEVRRLPSPDGVRGLGFTGDDEALARALVEGHPGAPAALYDRHAHHLRRVLARVMGVDQELPDLLHETFAAALEGVHKLDDPSRLKAWLTSVAVFTARGCIRRRQRWRWRSRVVQDLPERTAPSVSHEAREALRATYSVLDRIPADERIAFALRVVDGMELTEVAAACDVSLATIKRRIARARKRFTVLARRHPVLADRFHPEEGR